MTTGSMLHIILFCCISAQIELKKYRARTVINIAAEAKLADKQMMGVRLNATCVEKDGY